MKLASVLGLAEWTVANDLPDAFASVRVRASNVHGGGWLDDKTAADGEYEGFWDDEDHQWICYVGEPSPPNAYVCEVTHWQPLKPTKASK